MKPLEGLRSYSAADRAALPARRGPDHSSRVVRWPAGLADCLPLAAAQHRSPAMASVASSAYSQGLAEHRAGLRLPGKLDLSTNGSSGPSYALPPSATTSPLNGPLSASARSQSPPATTPSLPSHRPEELAQFTALARRAIFDNDPSATRQLDVQLRNVSAASRPHFVRAQAQVRAEFHAAVELQAKEELESVMRGTAPGSSVQKALGIGRAAGAAAMRSSAARRERQTRVVRFLRDHAHRTMPGPHAFLRSLHAALVHQSMPIAKGGGGRRLLEWAIDDAVWSHAGSDFLRDGVELLKGVLGFDETLAPANASSYLGSDDGLSDGESMRRMSAPRPVSPSRPRAGSDPFQDPRLDPPTPGIAPNMPLLASTSPERTRTLPPAGALTIGVPSMGGHSPSGTIRIFTLAPYLTDCELDDLARLFPAWLHIAPSAAARRQPSDVEALGPQSHAVVPVAGGHGELHIGARPRDDGWHDTWFTRLMHRLRHLFG